MDLLEECAVVGSECVLECGSEVGASAILREQSLLQSGQAIPDGETWAGSPARPAPEASDPVVELMASCAAAPRTWSRALLTGFAGGILLLELLPFLIMLPVAISTGDPIRAWETGLAWAFIIGVIVLIGAFVGPYVRRYTPRAAMLGTLAGISLAFISTHADSWSPRYCLLLMRPWFVRS